MATSKGAEKPRAVLMVGTTAISPSVNGRRASAPADAVSSITTKTCQRVQSIANQTVASNLQIRERFSRRIQALSPTRTSWSERMAGVRIEDLVRSLAHLASLIAASIVTRGRI